MQAKFWIGIGIALLLGGCGSVGLEPKSSGRPAASAAASAPEFVGAGQVKVARGDTVYAVSRRHKVPMRAIIEANGLTPPYLLRVGQWLTLPRVAVHTVRRGDTLYGIAARYDTEMPEVARLNGLKAPYVIYPGQRLALPWKAAKTAASAGKSVSGPTTSATVTSPKSVPVARPQPGQKVKVARRTVERPAAAPPPPKSSGRFDWPVRGRVVSSFGSKGKGERNDGINIAAPRGTWVRAAENGVVVYAGNELKGFGNLLLLKHGGGYVTAYAHNQVLLVARGAKVKKGQKIARVGTTGGVAEPQLHFEVRRGKKAVNPLKYLPKAVAGLDSEGQSPKKGAIPSVATAL